MEDIETILNTLIYDGKVEMTIIAAKEGTVGSVDGQMRLYRAVSPLIQPTGLVRTPCGLCPVSNSSRVPFVVLAALEHRPAVARWPMAGSAHESASLAKPTVLKSCLSRV